MLRVLSKIANVSSLPISEGAPFYVTLCVMHFEQSQVEPKQNNFLSKSYSFLVKYGYRFILVCLKPKTEGHNLRSASALPEKWLQIGFETMSLKNQGRNLINYLSQTFGLIASYYPKFQKLQSIQSNTLGKRSD